MTLKTLFLGTALSITAALPAAAEMATSVNQAVNFFQNAQATGGAPMTVDAKGPVEITDGIELPKFAFAVYDIDATGHSITMNLVAQLEKLQITLYDDTTFDRYYFELDRVVTSAEIAASSDENFKASVEIIAPGTTVTSKGAFVKDLGTEYTFENGAILVTVGEGTDLTKVTANKGALTVNF